MKMTNLACGMSVGILASVCTVAGANPDMQSALANCRDEAVSTGLQEEPDIQAYLNLCMQAWQSPDGYQPPDVLPETHPEAVVEPPPMDNPQDTTLSQ